MLDIIMPAKLLYKALQYIEKHSDLIWQSGDAPTSYCPDCPDYWYIRLARSNNGRFGYSLKSNYDPILYEFNELDQFIKGYERR